MKEMSCIQEYSFKLIDVDDGSTDKSFKVLKKLERIGTNSKKYLIKFTRNLGHQSALLVGVHLSTGGIIVTIDSDG